MLWTALACCCTAATSCASSSVCWAQPHSHSTRFCIPHLLAGSTRVHKIMHGGVWQMFGDPMLRIYLAGEVAVELGEQLLREADLPGRQGRLALVYLVMERERAVPQSELAELLWPESLPASWPVALSAVVSKLRQKLGNLGLDRDRIIANAFRCYQFRPPSETRIDLEAAAERSTRRKGPLLRTSRRPPTGRR